MSISIYVIIALARLLSVSTASQIPRCQDRRIIFTAQPADKEIGCDTSEVATFPCHYTGSSHRPLWIINSTTHSSVSSLLPPEHSYSNYTLFVRSRNNNTEYQCQLQALSREGSLCAYKSAIGRLIVKCKALDVNGTPHYQFSSSGLDHLVGISTIITQPDSFNITFNITYSDSLSDKSCGSTKIPSSSCGDRICRDEFNISLSLYCFNATAISVTVTSIHPDLHGFSYKSEPITIDAVNNFVRVSFESSILYLNFINQSKEGEKFYSITYGPVTPGCKQLPSKTTGHLSNVNYLSLRLAYVESTSICFILVLKNSTKSVNVEGVYAPALLDNIRGSTLVVVMFILIAVAVIIASVAVISGMYCYFTNREYTYAVKNGHQNKEEEIEGELDENYTSTEAKENSPSPIERFTTYFKLLTVTDECLMYEFGTEHFPGYQPEDGYGYFKKCASDLESIALHKKLILMDEGLPKFTTFSSVTKQATDTYEVYEQNKSYTMKLTPGSSFLYCARSKEITSTTSWKIYNVSKKCKESSFAEKNIPRYTSDWSRYCYFEFTKSEHIKPHQRIIVLMKDGKLVTGPGVRHLVGAIGDGSKMTHPSEFSEKWDHVFIQSRSVDRELIPGTKYLFCAMMDRVRAHYSIYNIHKKCNMAEFGKKHIPGFKPELGYGYYEFVREEFFKPHKKVILVHKDKKLFTGSGAQFICAGDEYNMDAILQKNKISPPDLTDTEWKHIFIQSNSTKRDLLPDIKKPEGMKEP